MLSYSVGRILRIIPTLLLSVTVIFFAARVLPGDPAEALLGQMISQEAAEALRSQLGLKEPIWRQYLRYMGKLLQGDLGNSLVLGASILELLRQVMPFTAIIVFGGISIGVVIGIPLGIASAVHRNSWIDYVTRLVSLGGVSMPGFVIGILLILVFSVWLRWLPMVGGGDPSDLGSLLSRALMPCLAGGLAMAAYVTRLARSTMLEVINEDYVRTARAKGLVDRSIMYKHALRNAFIPILTLIGIYVVVVVGDSIAIEIVFSRPGFGRLVQGAISQRDYTMLQSIFMLYVAFSAVVNLVLDLLYGLIDPRDPAGVGDHVSATQGLAPGAARIFFGNPLVRAGLVLSVFLVVMSLVGPLLPLRDPFEQDILHRLDPPSWSHWLGTDAFGRDVLSRLVQASRNSLTIALLGIAVGVIGGTVLGVLAGYVGGVLDKGVSEFINVFLAFPPDVVGILVLVAVGGGFANTALAIGMAFVPRFARLARASTLSLREQAYVDAGRALGAGQYRLMARYIFPGISGTIMVTATVWIATAIRAEAGLSFLGLGVQPPRESWGSMIGQGLVNMLDAPWVILCPTLSIMYAVVSFNMVGDGLRDFIDPRTRNT